MSCCNPKCSVPLYLFEKESDVRDRGNSDGYCIATIASILITFLTCIVLFSDYYTYREVIYCTLTCIILCLFCYLFFPVSCIWITVNRWKAYRLQFHLMEKKGFTHKESLLQIENVHVSEKQINALNSISTSVLAGAIISKKS